MKGEFKIDLNEKQIFIIVWLTDEVIAKISSNGIVYNEKLQVFVGVQKIAQNIYSIRDMNSCLRIFRNNSHQSIFLIVDICESISEDDYTKLCSFINFEYIYHFGWTNLWKKAMGEVSNDLGQLSKEKSNLHILPSNVIKTHIKGLDAETQRFIIHQLLIEILERQPRSAEAMKDFATYCRQTYHNDDVRLTQINEYEERFIQRSSIWWYTTNTFAFRILNKMLRENDLNSMFKIRYYISDVYTQLKELYISQLTTSNARRCNSLNPRLNLVYSLSIVSYRILY